MNKHKRLAHAGWHNPSTLSGNSRLQRITRLAVQLTVVGMIAVGMWACSGTGTGAGGAVDARVIGAVGRQPGYFVKPRAVAVTDADELVVIDRSGRIQVFDVNSGEFLRKWDLQDWTNGTPTGFSIDPKDGTMWVADTHYQRIIQYDTQGKILTQWGKEGTNPGEMIFPTDVCPDPDGKTVWVCEYGLRCRVMQYTREGEFVQEWGSGEYEYSDLQRPMAIAVDADGHILVADAGNHRILTFDRDGTLLNSWGTPGEEPGMLKYPYDMALAADGSLYLCEYGNSRVSRFTAKGEFLGAWGHPGHEPGGLFAPWGVAVCPDGRVVVADTNNGRLQVISKPLKAFVREGNA